MLHPIGQALAPCLSAGCRAVTGPVPRALFIGIIQLPCYFDIRDIFPSLTRKARGVSALPVEFIQFLIAEAGSSPVDKLAFLIITEYQIK